VPLEDLQLVDEKSKLQKKEKLKKMLPEKQKILVC
jgi:hypothetical protein